MIYHSLFNNRKTSEHTEQRKQQVTHVQMKNKHFILTFNIR